MSIDSDYFQDNSVITIDIEHNAFTISIDKLFEILIKTKEFNKMVGFTGHLFEGKSFVASKLSDMLVTNGFGVFRTSFASIIKQFIFDIYKVTKSSYTGVLFFDKLAFERYFNDLKRQYPDKIQLLGEVFDYLYSVGENNSADIRTLMQYVGTSLFRKLDEDYFVNKIKNAYSNFYSDFENAFFIIDDVRFPNEADFVKKFGYLIRVKRPIELCSKTTGLPIEVIEQKRQHISEVVIDKLKPDFIYMNK